MVAGLLLYVLIVFVPQRFAELEVDDPFTISVVTAAVSLAGSVSGYFYGRLRARMEHPGLLGAALTLWGLAFVNGALVSHPLALALSAVLFGAGSGISVPALAIMTGETAPPAMHGRAMALSGTANFSGQFAAPVVIGPLTGATSITTGFLAAAGLSAVVLLILAVLRPTVPQRAEPTPEPAVRKS